MAKQTWRNIPGFSTYQVSNLGQVRNTRTGRILSEKDWDHWSGRFSLYNRNRKATMNLEQIYRLAFKRNLPESLTATV